MTAGTPAGPPRWPADPDRLVARVRGRAAVWYLDVEPALRRDRLRRRHERYGMSPAQAAAWTDGPDEADAARIAARRDAADLVVVPPSEAGTGAQEGT